MHKVKGFRIYSIRKFYNISFVETCKNSFLRFRPFEKRKPLFPKSDPFELELSFGIEVEKIRFQKASSSSSFPLRYVHLIESVWNGFSRVGRRKRQSFYCFLKRDDVTKLTKLN